MKKTAMKDPRSKYEDYLMADQEVAQLASVSVHTVKHWRTVGILPFVKVGKSPRVWLSVFNQVFQKPEPSKTPDPGTKPILDRIGGIHGEK